MPYVKNYIGERETGVMLECKIPQEDGAILDLGDYPEKVPVHETVWETPWQPEHAPVGSVVRYNSASSTKYELTDVTVKGHYWNGIRSWVILTDDECPIRGAGHTASFNGSHLREIVSRGNGGVQFKNNSAESVAKTIDNYKVQLLALPAGVKKPHLYAGRHVADVICYVMTTHPKFADFYHTDHYYKCVSEIADDLRGSFALTRLSPWRSYVTISKKKLIKLLLNYLNHNRSSKLIAYKEERRAEEESYQRDMVDYDKHFSFSE